MPFREIVEPGDIKEFDLGRPWMFGAPKAVRTAAGERPPRFEVERFEQEGFVEAVSVRVHGRREQGAKGVLSVFGFESRAGAEGEMAVERKWELEVNLSQGGAGNARLVGQRFLVPGVVGPLESQCDPTGSPKDAAFASGLLKRYSSKGTVSSRSGSPVPELRRRIPALRRSWASCLRAARTPSPWKPCARPPGRPTTQASDAVGRGLKCVSA